jgi:hypothetical protein
MFESPLDVVLAIDQFSLDLFAGLLKKLQNIRPCPGQLDHVGIPTGVDDAKVVANERQRQTAKPIAHPVPHGLVQHRLRNRPPRFIQLRLAVKPITVGPAIAEQNVQLVIAKSASREMGLDQMIDPIDNARTVRTTVHKVADKDQLTTGAVPTMIVVTEVAEQRSQRVNLAVHVANDVDRSVRQWLNQ